ncbi:MAG TPA: acetyltransferase [Gammaproteobacteria bacterium]|jgi:hypothetical protein|nr:DHH family phosphoesterase [Pseudomonadota bacterium]HAY46162.1 acetyltransferase [Gammaproteobacteria bacterium]
MQHDVFNGDADGLCALTQLRLENPCESKLITGIKRDISLLERVNANPGDHVTVLDVSLDKNRDALTTLLDKGISVHYVDHHYAGDIPQSKILNTNINTSANVCTSLLINQELSNKYSQWAICGCYGDNLIKTADALSKNSHLNERQRNNCQSLGTYLNHNGYGGSLEDLHFHPEVLFKRISKFSTPQDFISADRDTFKKLESGYSDDLERTKDLQPHYQDTYCRLFLLPDAAWARRVSGSLSNQLSNQIADKAHAVLTEKANGDFLVSVRAPLNNKTGADDICRQFPTGGGRKGAAGINNLKASELGTFITTLSSTYKRNAAL